MNFLIPGEYFTSVKSKGDLGDNKKKIDFLNLNVEDIVLTAQIVLEYGLKMEVKLEDNEQPCGTGIKGHHLASWKYRGRLLVRKW